MQLTADMILTDFGTVLPLDRRRRDALASYAKRAAWADGARSAQRWTEKRWDLKDYEAKDLLKGNASEAVWERIVKHRNGQWAVVLPVLGAVIGKGLDEWLSERLAAEERRLADEREQYQAQRRDLGEMALAVRAVFGLGAGREREPDLRADRDCGPWSGDLGARQDAAPEAVSARDRGGRS